MTASDVAMAQSPPGADGEDNHQVHRKWRERQAWRTGRSGILSKLVTVGTRVITIPLSLRLLGPERYGLWLTVGSLLTWLAVYDLGIGAGLVNAVGSAHGRGDQGAMRRHVSTAFLGLAGMSALMLAMIAGASHWSGLPRLLGIQNSSPLAADASVLVLICGVIFAVSFSLNCANQLATALQEGYLAAYGQISASVVSCALLAVFSLRGASIIEFAIIMGAPPVLASGALAGYLFLSRHADLRPALSRWSFSSLRSLYGCGTPIFISQLAYMAILSSANLLISNRLGPGQVPSYAVPFSAFMIASTVCYSLVAPYQPAYAEAFGRGDREWIRKTAMRTLGRNVALMSACGVAMAALGGILIRIWTHGRVAPPRSLLAAMAVYFVANVWAQTNGILLIGIGCVKTKAALQGCVSTIHIAGAWLLLPVFGIIAIPIAGTAAFLLDVALAMPLALRHLRNSAAPAAAHATGPSFAESALQ